jgi:hypothetical protein
MCVLLNNLLFHTCLSLWVTLSVEKDTEARIVVPGISGTNITQCFTFLIVHTKKIKFYTL